MKRFNHACAALMAFLTACGLSHSNTDDTSGATTAALTMGERKVLPTSDNGNANLLLAQQATLSQPGTLKSLAFYVTNASGSLVLGVYDSTGPSGGPGAQVVQTMAFSPVVGWNTADVTSPVSLAAGKYWLAYLPSDNNLAFRKGPVAAGVAKSRYYAYAFGAMPSTFSTSPNTSSYHWSLYATLVPPTTGGNDGGTTGTGGGTSITFGETNILADADDGNANLLVAQSATLSQSATLQSLSFYVTTATGNLILGVYDSTGPSGGPGAKLAQTASMTPIVGWNTANVTSPVSLAAGNYWIAYLPSDNNLAFRKADVASGVSASRCYAYAFGAMPSTFSASPNTTSSHWSLYGSLIISGGTPPPPADGGTADTTPPSAPSNLVSSNVTQASAKLSWTASTDNVGVAGYSLYLSGTKVGSSTSTSFTFTGLSCGTSDTLAVEAYDMSLNRSLQAALVVATAACTTPPPPSPDAGTGGSQTHCFASPGSCGYPDPAYHNVGVPAGTQLTPSGDITVTVDGTVINGMDVTGSISITANNVTIQNTRVTCPDCENTRGYTVFQENTVSGLIIKNSELSGGNVGFFGAPGSFGETMAGVSLTNCDACVQYAQSVKDSYVVPNAVPPGGSHYEATYNSDQTLDVEHSTFLNPHEQTATIFMDMGNSGPCDDNLTVNNSLLAGGGYLIYACNLSTSAGNSHATLTNNRFARCTSTPIVASGSGYTCQGYGSSTGDGDVLGNPDHNGYYPYGGFFGGVLQVWCNQATWSNNVWDDDNSIVGC